MTADVGQSVDSPSHTDERLHVVVPVHNGAEFLPALLGSLAKQSRPPERIHLVDNGSDDAFAASTVDLSDDLSQLVLIRRERESLGFSAACNLGIEAAVAEGAEFILILNQDLMLEPNACERAVDVCRQRQDIGLLGLFQMSYDGRSLDPPFRGLLPSRAIDDAVLGTLKDVYECEFVPAAAVLVPRSTFEQVGLFDPLFFMYQEDKDFCRRIRRAGLGIAVATRARVCHDSGQLRAEKSRSWKANWILSQAVYHLKWSPRPLGVAFLTLAKYILPKWNLGESSHWLSAAMRCLKRHSELRRRRCADDGLQLKAAPPSPDEDIQEVPSVTEAHRAGTTGG